MESRRRAMKYAATQSSELGPEVYSTVPVFALARRLFAWFSGSRAPVTRTVRFASCQMLLIGEIAEDRRDQQEDRDRETMPRGDVPRFGSAVHTRKAATSRRHLVDGRLRAIRIGHLPVRRQRRRHRDVEVREVGIVVQVRRRLGVRELLQELGRLVLDSRSGASRRRPRRPHAPWSSATGRAEARCCSLRALRSRSGTAAGKCRTAAPCGSSASPVSG